MQIEIAITLEPIDLRRALPKELAGSAGAVVEFAGLVRGEENGQPIAALEYEAYSPMAEREMRRILEALALAHPCRYVRVTHRVGVVPVGEAAIQVVAASAHRAEALALVAEFMDRLKQDVPIWKRRAVLVAQASCRCEPASAASSETASRQDLEPHRQDACATGEPRAASASEVLALLRQLGRPLAVERVVLAEALGRTLREPACALEDQPPFDRSSVDGYAVRLDDCATQFRIVDEIRAGDWKPRELRAGEAMRVATGGALPGDGLQVVMKEDVHVEGDRLTVLRRNEERNIRSRGEDARAGQALVEAGTVLQAGTLALLASIGCAQPRVTRLPRVLHLATGNEIVPPDQTPGRGQIRDSNSTLVRAFLAPWGIVPEQRCVAEDEERLKSEVRSPKSEGADLWLISGGASVGEHDFTRRLLESLDFTIHVRRTTARPGKPLIVAQRGGTLAFGLPGNPLAHFVCLNLYVRAALEAFAGRTDEAPDAFQMGVLAADLDGGGNARETFWPARWELSDGAVSLTPLRWSSSGDLTALATANALIHLAAGAGKLTSGSQVEFSFTTERA